MKQRLIKTKDQRKAITRVLTGHVTTRHYRAPEIILLEKDYGTAIDIWAAGCIFGELLAMMKVHTTDSYEQKTLFPGKTCFPLTPGKNVSDLRKRFGQSTKD